MRKDSRLCQCFGCQQRADPAEIIVVRHDYVLAFCCKAHREEWQRATAVVPAPSHDAGDRLFDNEGQP